MKKVMLGSIGLVFVAFLFFQPPLQANGGSGYKQTNCLRIGERKCMSSGSDCATSYPCKLVRKIKR